MTPERHAPHTPLLRLGVEAGIIDLETARRLESLRDHADGADAGLEGASGYDPVAIEPRPSIMSFADLVPFETNGLALELARCLARVETPPWMRGLVVFHGASGMGKSHLLSAIARETTGAVVVDLVDLDAEIEHAARLGRRAELRHWLRTVRLLLLDDVDRVRGNDALQGELLALLDHRVDWQLPTVVATAIAPAGLEGLEPQLHGRLGSGVVAGLRMGSEGERRALLTRIVPPGSLSDEVLAHVAAHASDSVQRLKAAALQLLAMRDGGVEITLDVARAIVPRPEDLSPLPRHAPAGAGAAQSVELAARYKSMVAQAETEQEQVLALQIAIGDRLRQIRAAGSPETIRRLEKSLELLREGRAQDALAVLGTVVPQEAAQGGRGSGSSVVPSGRERSQLHE